MGSNDKVLRVIRAVRAYAATRGVTVPAVKLRWDCTLARKAHASSKRFLAHTFHAKNTICLVPAINKLPLPKLAGIVVHELGHILSGVHVHGAEPAADEWVREHLDLDILYDSKDSLEYLDDGTLRRLRLLEFPSSLWLTRCWQGKTCESRHCQAQSRSPSRRLTAA